MTFAVGDLKLKLPQPHHAREVDEAIGTFLRSINEAVNNKRLDHAALRKVLPSAGLRLTAGPDNPFSRYLAMKDIPIIKVNVLFGTTPAEGINGRLRLADFRSTPPGSTRYF